MSSPYNLSSIECIHQGWSQYQPYYPWHQQLPPWSSVTWWPRSCSIPKGLRKSPPEHQRPLLCCLISQSTAVAVRTAWMCPLSVWIYWIVNFLVLLPGVPSLHIYDIWFCDIYLPQSRYLLFDFVEQLQCCPMSSLWYLYPQYYQFILVYWY